MVDKTKNGDGFIMDAFQQLVSIIASRIAHRPESVLNSKGSLTLLVRDKRSFTIRFGQRDNPFSLDYDPKADFLMIFSENALGQFVAGKLDVANATQSKDLILAGDPKVYRSFRFLLQTESNALGIRLGRHC